MSRVRAPYTSQRLEVQSEAYLATDGGMNDSPFLGQIGLNQASILQNMILNPNNGSWRNRRGSVAYRDAVADSGDFRNLIDFQYRSAGVLTRKFVAVAGTGLYRDDGSGWTSLGVTLGDVTNPALAVFTNLCLCCDGTSFYKWTGTGDAAALGGNPPASSLLAVHRNRLWAAGDPDAPYRVTFSDAGLPEQWPLTAAEDLLSNVVHDTNAIDIDRSDEIIALLPWYDFLVLFGNDNIYLVTGWQPSASADGAFNLVRIATSFGTRSPGAVLTVPGVEGGERLFFQGQDGHFYAIPLRPGVEDGAEVVCVSEQISDMIGTLSASSLGTSRGVYVPSLRSILWSCQRTGVLGDVILCYNVKFNAWTYWDGLTVRALGVVEDSDDAEHVYGGTNVGQMVELNAGTDDDGTAIAKTVRTRVFDYGTPDTVKRFDAVTPSLYQAKNGGLTWSYILDASRRKDKGALTFRGSNLPYWGQGQWGALVWQETPILNQAFPLGEIGRSIQFEFKNEEEGEAGDFAMSGLSLSAQVLGMR